MEVTSRILPRPLRARVRWPRSGSALLVAARLAGYDPTGACRLTAGSTSAVYDLPGADVVMMIHPPWETERSASQRLRAAQMLSARLPFVEPAAAEPLRLPTGTLATVWRRVAVDPGPPDWYAAGDVLRRLHAVSPGQAIAAGLTLAVSHDLQDVASAVQRLVATGQLAALDGRCLHAVRRRLTEEIGEVPAPACVVHGDLHPPNLLSVANGCVLCDTDDLAVGHPSWDLARLVDPGRPDRLRGVDLDRFQDGYGGPVPAPEHARTLTRAAHLRRTVELVERAAGARGAYWNRVRLALWHAMLRDWSLDLVPAVEVRRGRQLHELTRSWLPPWRSRSSWEDSAQDLASGLNGR